MKYLILGAGPAGLSFANRLLQKGEKDFLVLEKESEAGGLCRSTIVDNSPLDIGGGHFLDIRNSKVNQFLFTFMPEYEWNIFDRNSQISTGGTFIHHPFEANIWEFDLDRQIEYLKSIAAAGCNTGREIPEKFTEWIIWKLGQKIADDYMLPYNRKMFGKNLDELGIEWLNKLPNVSFEDTLRSCLAHKAYGIQPGHAKFYYPKKYGYGELWIRMADALRDRIRYTVSVERLNYMEHTVSANGDVFHADTIVTTVPWMEFENISGVPEILQKDIRKLKKSSVRIDYYEENKNTDAHWIYDPAEELPYHRILVRHNLCIGSKGYWTETNLCRAADTDGGIYSYVNEYAYPLNTVDKPYIMRKLLKWSREHGVIGLGRWGEHEHFNSDVTVERAIALAEGLV